MNCLRRRILLAFGLGVFLPRLARAQGRLDGEHRPHIDLPALSEDPAAVPIKVWVDHPMERDHFIRSLEIRVEQDPVPYKGRFLFTPANGRAWVAFQMRSGSGGLAQVTAECSKHGRFVATRQYRVTEGGCGAVPDPLARVAPPAARLRLPGSVKAGEIIEVRTKVEHNSDTGLEFKGGKYVRAAPEFYVKRMAVLLDNQRVCEFELTAAVSPNPVIRFPLKVTRGGMLRVTFLNSEGRRWEASQQIQPAG